MKSLILSLFIGVFAFYSYFTAPTVAPQGDSGELVTVSYLGGIAHPPGYPLYTLIGYMFSLLPWGSVAWRVNLSSALFHSATVVVFFLVALRLMKDRWVAIIAALILAFSYTFWLYSLVAEVFALNDLLAMLIVYFTVVPKNWQSVVFLFGLGMSNHHTIILLSPAVVYFFWPQVKRVLRGSHYLIILGETSKILLLFGLGLLPYLYIWIRAKFSIVPVAWAYPSNIFELWRLFSRGDYGSFSSVATQDPALALIGDKAGQLINYFRFLVDDFGWQGILIAIIGIIVIWFRQKRLGRFLVLAFTFSSLIFLSYANFPFKEFTGTGLNVVERFYLLPNLFVAIFVAFGLRAIFGFFRKIRLNWVAVAFCLVYISLLFLFHYQQVSQRDNYLTENFGRNVLTGVPEKSLILLQGDIPTFASFYERYVDNVRSDVEFLTANQILADNNYRYLKKVRPDLNLELPLAASPAGILLANKGKVDIFTFGPPSFKLEKPYYASPSGLLFKIMAENRLSGFASWKEDQENILASYRLPTGIDVGKRRTFGDMAVLSYYVRMFQYLGDICRQADDLGCAEKYYQMGLSLAPDDAFLNLYMGLVYQKGDLCSKAEEKLVRVFTLTGDLKRVVTYLVDLAEDCFRDESKAEHYRKQQRDIEMRLGGSLKEL